MLIYEGVIVLELVLMLRLDSANFDALEGVMICPELLSVNLPLILPRTESQFLSSATRPALSNLVV